MSQPWSPGELNDQVAPARTPQPVLDRPYAQCTAVSQRFLAEQGLIHLPNTQASFAARSEAESARWRRSSATAATA